MRSPREEARRGDGRERMEKSLGRTKDESRGRKKVREESSRDAGRHGSGKNGNRGINEESRGDSRDIGRDPVQRSKDGRKESRSKGADRESIRKDRSRDKTRGRGGLDRNESVVSVKVEARRDRGDRERVKPKEVWRAPMPGMWQPTEGSGLPAWDKSKLKKEDNPPDWVEPPKPKVDLSLLPYRNHFDRGEIPLPPVTPLESKEELLLAHEIPEDDPVVVLFPRGYVRTTRRGLKESKRSREKEERDLEETLVQMGGSCGRQRGKGREGVNPKMEAVAQGRGFGGSRDRRERSGEKRRYKERESRAYERKDRGESRDERRGERRHSRDERRDKRGGAGYRDYSGDRKEGKFSLRKER